MSRIGDPELQPRPRGRQISPIRLVLAIGIVVAFLPAVLPSGAHRGNLCVPLVSAWSPEIRPPSAATIQAIKDDFSMITASPPADLAADPAKVVAWYAEVGKRHRAF